MTFKTGLAGRLAGVVALAGLIGANAAYAQDAPVASDVSAYVDNSLLFLISGLVVMFMAAGFCMLEAGLVRSKNASVQVVKNISLYSIAGLMFYFIGYQLLYSGYGDGPWLIENYLAVPGMWSPSEDLGNGYAAGSDHYFQMVFVATAASIVSGTVAERIKLWPFLIFVAVLTGVIYPIQCSWQWGEGFLSDAGFSDFAGSTLVHSTGGWAALAGAIILGPRMGKYVDGRVNPMPGSNIPLAALGTFILWFGWFGFNGGSQLAAGTFDDINAVSMIFLNTNTAAAAGTVTAMILTNILYKKVDATMVFNGALAGLVSITAEPLTPVMWEAAIIGAVGGLIVVFTVPLLDKLKIDDVVGAIPVHLFAGIWGTLIVAWNTQTVKDVLEDGTEVSRTVIEQLGVQLMGVVSVGLFVTIASAVVWLALKFTVGIRISEEEEMDGLDLVECGLEAYPEFSKH